MRVVSAKDMQTRRGPMEWFTGTVWLDASPAGTSPGAGVFRVLFEPGARTNWHAHPEGQILHVISGTCRAQKEGEPIVAPNEKHWHGAAPDTFMIHVAINPAMNTDGGTDWLEPVTDEQYACS